MAGRLAGTSIFWKEGHSLGRFLDHRTAPHPEKHNGTACACTGADEIEENRCMT